MNPKPPSGSPGQPRHRAVSKRSLATSLSILDAAERLFAERGYDAEQVDRDIAAERARERALGLDFRRPGSPAQGVQSLPGDQNNDISTDQTGNAPDPANPEEQP